VTATYAFRDTDTAVARLQLVAELFEPTTRVFLAELGRRDVGLALDLGSGPGHTTRLIAEELAPRRLVAVDTSPRFVELAAASGFETLAHDVTEAPFPIEPADLLVCRFLLSHVAQPAETVATWARGLAPRGRILAEEVEWIRTADPVFDRYLTTVRTLLAARGHRLEVGPSLASLEPAGLRRRASRVVTLSPDPGRVAWMFLLNLRAWSDDPLVLRETAAELEAGLAAGPHGEITWGLRQIGWEADG
jgi:trans-aconitate 2-methyltransferase